MIKLTDSLNKTRGLTWGTNVTHSVVVPENPRLCSEDVLHAYRTVSAALILNPIHNDVKNPVLWRSIGDQVVSAWDQVGCSQVTTVERVDTPDWYSDDLKRERVYADFMLRLYTRAKPIVESYGEAKDFLTALQVAESYAKNPAYLQDFRKAFRDLLHCTYGFYMDKAPRPLADSAYVVYIWASCLLTPSYLHNLMPEIWETAALIGIDCDYEIEEAIEAVK